MKRFNITLAAAAMIMANALPSSACTNFIVTRGASTDSSVMVSYAADSHQLYGCLYHYMPSRRAARTMPVYEWDTGRYIGDIAQAAQTYSTVGNMNEHSLLITATTFGGRHELENPDGGIDYGSLIYITLQRARTAREAIRTIVDLADTYGYCSSGESFTIADPDEAWIMELIGRGKQGKGIVWVARRIPDGYVSAHANQARITTFPKNDPENCLYSDDVVELARSMGWYEGTDEDFSFADAYAPLDFSAMRGCEARVWSFFRTVADDMDKYVDYAMGHNPDNRMPLWVKPRTKVSPKMVFDAMRDHYEGTPMDMTTDLGAGGHGLPYRWRPMNFEVDGIEYKLSQVARIDAAAAAMSPAKARKYLTEYSVNTAQQLFDRWVELDRYLLVKYIDGNVKGENADGFIDNGNGRDIPGKIEWPGYNEKWKRAVAADNGEVLRVVK